MRKKAKFKIGEFSQMMQVTVKTLRHYEQKGLLLPYEVDEWTGYRYYSIEQMQRLGCKCPPPGYCFTIEHNKEYRPTDIDIEYCEQVEELGTDSDIIQFKCLAVVPKALCMKHVGPMSASMNQSLKLLFTWRNMAIRLQVIFVFPILMVYGIRKIRSYGYR